eukprot:762427-Hanusia_phi.AAC.2
MGLEPSGRGWGLPFNASTVISAGHPTCLFSTQHRHLSWKVPYHGHVRQSTPRFSYHEPTLLHTTPTPVSSAALDTKATDPSLHDPLLPLSLPTPSKQTTISDCCVVGPVVTSIRPQSSSRSHRPRPPPSSFVLMPLAALVPFLLPLPHIGVSSRSSPVPTSPQPLVHAFCPTSL